MRVVREVAVLRWGSLLSFAWYKTQTGVSSGRGWYYCTSESHNLFFILLKVSISMSPSANPPPHPRNFKSPDFCSRHISEPAMNIETAGLSKFRGFSNAQKIQIRNGKLTFIRIFSFTVMFKEY